MFIRPVRADDHADILKLAEAASFGMTSLPAEPDVLRDKIAHAEASFAGDASVKGNELFLFVLEDPATGQAVGTTGIKAHVGLNQPFYSYKLSTITQQSRELQLFSKHQLLHVTNDLTGVSEIGSLFLSPDYRRDRLGRLLSLSRFLFMASFKDYFAEEIIAELRGFHDPSGRSPFYDSIARHFFEMDFPKADYLNATQGNEFINDLMPKYPIYVSLLPNPARDVIGQPHPNSAPAKAMLEREGFRWDGYIDIFDGGPTLEADIRHIRTINDSAQHVIIASEPQSEDTPKYMLSNERLADFRCCAARARLTDEGIIISAKTLSNLNAHIGDAVRLIAHHRN